MNCSKIITAWLLTLCFNCFSQSQFNASVGYGLDLLRFHHLEGNPEITISYKTGSTFMAGCGYKYKFKRLIGLGADLSILHTDGSVHYKRQGTATWLHPVATYNREEVNEFKLTYITLPVYVNFYYKRFSLDLGFQNAFAVLRGYTYTDKFMFSNGTTTTMRTGGQNKYSYLRQYDYGFFAALNVSITKRVDVFVRYYKSQINLLEGGTALYGTQIIIGARFYFVSKTKTKAAEKAVKE